MDWAWIAIVTLKLTRENIIRMKDTLLKFVSANPEISAVGLLFLTIVVLALIIKYVKSS